ncbi:lipopolysaccharide assembly protein LapB [Halomonas sp.]|uniref:lipopolysaccharide assembly protein LapB n=1 Tax=Halomonas sp. TaxID=1486246 RepID=UPI003565BC7C
MPDPLLLLLLLAAVATGWWLGRRQRRRSDDPGTASSLSRDYFVGLNYLLNDQQDRAIETFVAALEVNSETIDTHITLGNLFRLRGEADRAVKIHQNLLARPTLSVTQSERVQLELARDFFRLGLLDRAERLLQGLIRDSRDAECQYSAKRLLVDLLEREGEWNGALEVALPQLADQDEDIRRAAAHWLCELAEQERHEASPGLARKHLRRALSTDPGCVRANLLLAELEHDTGHYKKEIGILKRIPDQDPAYTPTILASLERAYRLLDNEPGLIRCLQELVDRAPYTSVVLMLTDTLRQQDGSQAASALVSEHLERHPSLGKVDCLMELYRHDGQGATPERLDLLKRHTHTLLHALPQHRCRRCGFSGDPLHWLCPQCRSWGTTKPITGIEGD